MTRAWLGAALLLAPAVAACELLFPTVAEQPGKDAGADAGNHVDAGGVVDDGPYANPAHGDWQIYSFGFASTAYRGGAFDGRYVYLSPGGGPVERHDTHAPFGSGWSGFDPAKLGDGGGNTFSGALFDGRFVNFTAFRYDNYYNDAVFVRYDTHAEFDAPSSWQELDLTRAQPAAVSFSGEAFDGRFIYFAPKFNAYAVRYDTTLSFDDPSSWAGFDLGPMGALGFEGAVYDGSYLYLVPDYHWSVTDGGFKQGPATGMAARYDTHAAFGSKASWTLFDTKTLPLSPMGFVGGAFDGRFLYFVPSGTSVAVRYDTRTHAFDSASSWETFDCSLAYSNAWGYAGAAYDGRYIWFVPSTNAAVAEVGVLLRYDTTGRFGDVSSWLSYDISRQSVNAVDFIGAVFDGEDLYFVPYGGGVVARFHDRATPFPQRLPTLPGSFL